MDFLRDPIVDLLIGIIVSIILSIVFYLIQRSRKEIAYRIISNSTVLSVKAAEEVKSRVQVLLDNKPVSDARIVVLKIWNAGNVSIKFEDYIEPIKINFGKAEVLNAEITEVKPTNIKLVLSLNSHEVKLEPTLLNSKDFITLKVLLTKFNNEILVISRIVGIKEIVSLDQLARKNRCMLFKTMKYIISFAIVMAIFLFAYMYYDYSTNTKLFLERYPTLALYDLWSALLIFLTLFLIFFIPMLIPLLIYYFYLIIKNILNFQVFEV